MERDDDLEIIDVENYQSGKDFGFSHQLLVMKAMMKCLELGSKEMHVGYLSKEEGVDGKVKIIYKEDTRKAFIESVKTLDMIMSPDKDEAVFEKIKKIEEEITKTYKYYLHEQRKLLLQNNVKTFLSKKGIFYYENELITELPFYNQYISSEVDIYRKIFAELNILAKRCDYFVEERYEA